MPNSYLTGAYPVAETSQSEPIPGREMAKNSAGGFGFSVDDFKRTERFLILGNEGGTYYASGQSLSKENAQSVARAILSDGPRVVKMIRDISVSGRAPKNDQAIFCLALAASIGDARTKELALLALPDVCRIGTHLFRFAEFIDNGKMRGWGRALRSAVGEWYLSRSADKLAYQLTKYQQRNGWSHRDILRLSHPKATGVDSSINPLLGWVVRGEPKGAHPLIAAFEEAKTCTDKLALVKLIREHGLTREMIPTQFLNDADVWAALLEKMPLTAMIRNLGKMSQVGLLAPMSAAVRLVTARLADPESLKKSRVHPVAVFFAMRTYSSGHGLMGSLQWTVVPQIVDALDEAFYASFGNIPSTGKRFYLGIDVSGSMAGGAIAGSPDVTPREAAGLMAMVTARSEQNYFIAGFSNGSRVSGRTRGSTMHHGFGSRYIPSMEPLNFTANDKLDKVCDAMARVPMGGTDCALPMLDASAEKIPVDCFVIYTDNETWAGAIHPTQALQKYRQKMGIQAKLVVQAFTATSFTIADPSDAGQIDVVGFDTSTPSIIADFAADCAVVSATDRDD